METIPWWTKACHHQLYLPERCPKEISKELKWKMQWVEMMMVSRVRHRCLMTKLTRGPSRNLKWKWLCKVRNKFKMIHSRARVNFRIRNRGTIRAASINRSQIKVALMTPFKHKISLPCLQVVTPQVKGMNNGIKWMQKWMATYLTESKFMIRAKCHHHRMRRSFREIKPNKTKDWHNKKKWKQQCRLILILLPKLIIFQVQKEAKWRQLKVSKFSNWNSTTSIRNH